MAMALLRLCWSCIPACKSSGSGRLSAAMHAGSCVCCFCVCDWGHPLRFVAMAITCSMHG